MKKVSLILSAVVMAAMMLSSCGRVASNGGSASNDGRVASNGESASNDGRVASNGDSASNEVTIGSQVWMTKNLDVATFRNGDPIPQAKTYEEWEKAGENKQPAWCYYDNDPANGAKYGKLYNWYTVADPRNVCPVGWHVPTDAEWTVLTDYLG
jgi:hypothetical protein